MVPTEERLNIARIQWQRSQRTALAGSLPRRLRPIAAEERRPEDRIQRLAEAQRAANSPSYGLIRSANSSRRASMSAATKQKYAAMSIGCADLGLPKAITL